MKQLGTFCEFKYGRSLPEKHRQGGNFPVYGSNGIVGWHHEPITNGPTIIIGRKGSAGALQYSSMSCCPIDTTYYVDQSCTSVNLRWLFFMLQMLDLDALNKHAAVPGLNRNDAYEKELLLPSSDEQKKIAALLDMADALRHQRQESLQLAETLLRSCFLNIFGDPVSNSKNWPIVPLSELAVKFSDGPFGSNLKTEHYRDNGIRVWRLQDIGIGSLKNSGIAYISPQHYANLPKHHCAPGDVIVGTLGEPNLRAAIVPSTIPESLNKADCVQIRAKKGVALPEFICWLLNMPGTLALAHSLVLGETRARISMGRLRTLNVPLPPIGLQREFSQTLSRILALKELVLAQSPEVDYLFASIQQRAFRGELNLNRSTLANEVESPGPTSVPERPTAEGRFKRPGSFVAPPEIEAQMLELEDRIDYGPGDSISWSEDFFKYRILSQVLTPPFSFNEIWEAVNYDMRDANYEDVKAKVFEYIEAGTVEQRFDMERKEIVFYPRP
ncbi:restriction endonuclease subunit S [Granulicella mallensis]|uniref:Restriction modification system DNA specificity domain protein n=1 Tax=Granulicella mallensis (strain ATCC BAA-1857 / DSM 23137 / MP5ACTX8) TaxID=682795 RepID=G8NT45_GRAMM|nr:restriction endonuclease subunit S [Granulicella mallensis]AEU37475.1 restriction modification system DNA specificity domain protein [Granulicella mallensis MP5ACTX8]